MKQGDSFIQEFLVDANLHKKFIDTFADRNPLHVDDDYARSKGFAGKVMHGNILGGFLSYFVGEGLPIKNVIIHSQEIKYLKPVYLAEPIILNAVVDGFFESVGVWEFLFEFKDSHGKRLAKGKVSVGLLP